MGWIQTITQPLSYLPILMLQYSSGIHCTKSALDAAFFCLSDGAQGAAGAVGCG